MKKFLRFCSTALLMSVFAMQANGDVVVTTPLDTAASANAYGYESYNGNGYNGLLEQLQIDEIFGNGSVSAGFAFDSGAGLTGNLSSNQWATETHGPHSLSFSAAGDQSASVSNSSPDGFTSVSAGSFSFMRFSVGESGQAVLSLQGTRNLGSLIGSSSLAQWNVFVQVFSISGPLAGSSLFRTGTKSDSGIIDDFGGSSSTNDWSGGDTVTLDLTPGSEYGIVVFGGVNALLGSNGSIDDLSGAYDVTVSVSTVPVPSSLAMSAILLGMFGLVAAFRRAKAVDAV